MEGPVDYDPLCKALHRQSVRHILVVLPLVLPIWDNGGY